MPESYDDLRDKLAEVSTLVTVVQIDVMDGRFVESKSWPYNLHGTDTDFSKILHEDEGLPFWDRLDFEIDLIVEDPQQQVEKWMKAGASRLVIHIESIKDDAVSLLEEVKRGEVGVGLALDMDTDVEEVLPFLDYVDFVQLMGIDHDGFQGAPFDQKVLEKIKRLKEESPSTLISVDGGVNLETAPALIEAGADRLIIGSAIFESGDIEGAITDFESL